GTSSRKAAKQRRIIMLLKQSCDLFVVAMNGFGQQRDLLDQNVDLHRTGQQYGAVLGQGLGFFNVGQQLLQLVIAAISLSFVKLSNRGQTRLLQLLQRRPTLKKLAGARRYATHQTSPTLAENKSSAPTSADSSRLSARPRHRDGLRSAIGCCGSAHHRVSKPADGGDAISKYPTTNRHRRGHPWHHWGETLLAF